MHYDGDRSEISPADRKECFGPINSMRLISITIPMPDNAADN
jgi:hypothetical protein